jgi:hypothetical protein
VWCGVAVWLSLSLHVQKLAVCWSSREDQVSLHYRCQLVLQLWLFWECGRGCMQHCRLGYDKGLALPGSPWGNVRIEHTALRAVCVFRPPLSLFCCCLHRSDIVDWVVCYRCVDSWLPWCDVDCCLLLCSIGHVCAQPSVKDVGVLLMATCTHRPGPQQQQQLQCWPSSI